MSQKSRVEQLDDLLIEFSFLVDPLKRLIFDDDNPKQKIPQVRAQFRKELWHFIERSRNVCQDGNLFYEDECKQAIRATELFGHLLEGIEDPEKYPGGVEGLKGEFTHYMQLAREKLRAIPTDDPSTILSAESPFQTYLRLRAMCHCASRRLQIFDPYLDVEPFHLYLAAVSDSAEITVITSSAIARDSQRRDRIVTISELLAIERPTSYQFRVTQQQHDRHMRIDNDIFHLGSSFNSAAKKAPYTIGKLDPTQSNHAFLDDVITKATEWFGPGTPVHRKS
ncbi:MAG: hypothetical protein AB7G75_32100 [Candidatus Binatia bacterium]